MQKKKLFIAGDSFAANWRKKDSNLTGWVNLLENDYDITNFAQAGVSEYKIFLQIQNVDLSYFDKILIVHTSPYRIPIYEHPIHKIDEFHSNCDLILADLEEHLYDKRIKIAYDFFTYFFHKEYYETTHNLIFEKIISLLPQSVNITFFDIQYNQLHSYHDIFKMNRGKVNHLDIKGNQIIYESVKKLIN